MRKIQITENMTPIDRKCVEAGITRRELAQMSGIPYVTIDQWARCKRLPRDVYQLYKVTQALGCHIEDLIEPEQAKKRKKMSKHKEARKQYTSPPSLTIGQYKKTPDPKTGCLFSLPLFHQRHGQDKH